MVVNKTEFRVRYGETDQMGIVHHSVYPLYFEMGRTELFRQIGYPYTEMEKLGIIMPLVDLSVKYINPAKYDDLLVVETVISSYSPVKVVFSYRILDEAGKVYTTGETVLVCVNNNTGKPSRLPADVYGVLKKYFIDEKAQ